MGLCIFPLVKVWFPKSVFCYKGLITSWNRLLAISWRRPLAFCQSDHMHLKVSVYSWKIHILNWHVWFSRYLYIPLGGSKWRFLNVWIIFTFVAIWHDLEWWVPYLTCRVILIHLDYFSETHCFHVSGVWAMVFFELAVWVTAGLLEPLYLVMTIWQKFVVLL